MNELFLSLVCLILATATFSQILLNKLLSELGCSKLQKSNSCVYKFEKKNTERIAANKTISTLKISSFSLLQLKDISYTKKVNSNPLKKISTNLFSVYKKIRAIEKLYTKNNTSMNPLSEQTPLLISIRGPNST